MTLPELHISAARTEIFVLASALAVLLADLFVPAARRVLLHWASVALLVVAAGLAADGLGESPTIALGGFFAATPLAALLKSGALLAAAGSAAFSGRYLQSRGMMRGEFYALTLLAALGMCVMISAAHFLTLYLGLELMSLCLYAVIALRRDDNAAVESAVKYFVLGALASGLLLYGASILYGAAGDLSFAGVAAAAADSSGANRAALAFGLVFLLAGMAFKLGAAPFHMWLPDVYHGAPAAATLFIAAAPKVAALGMALRVLTEPLGGLQEEWREMLAVLAMASLALGNIAAIAQTNLKRMLAYSSIAHAGFMLLGVLAGGKDGAAAAAFYVLIYALTAVGGFGVIAALSSDRERDLLDDIRGLASRNGPLAIVVMLLMFSMAGVPPVAGFYAKYATLLALVKSDFAWGVELAVAAVLFSAVGAFYYLRVVKLAFFDSPEEGAGAISLDPAEKVMIALAGILTAALGLFPGGLLAVCEEAARLSLQ